MSKRKEETKEPTDAEPVQAGDPQHPMVSVAQGHRRWLDRYPEVADVIGQVESKKTMLSVLALCLLIAALPLWVTFLIPPAFLMTAFSGIAFHTARKYASRAKALTHVFERGTLVRATVTDHPVPHSGSVQGPTVEVSYQHRNRAGRTIVQVVKPAHTHPLGSTLWIVVGQDTEPVFVPDAYGLRFAPRALTAKDLGSVAAPVPPRAKQQRVALPGAFDGTEVGVDAVWPPVAMLEALETYQAGTDIITVDGGTLSIETTDERPVTSLMLGEPRKTLTFDLARPLVVLMSRSVADSDEAHVVVTLRQRTKSGWMSWGFSMLAAALDAATDGPTTSALAPMDAAAPKLDSASAIALLAHLATFRA